MALSKLQSDILRLLAKNRSESSYLAGGLMLNKDWQRRSDDIDIFHDTDEEVTETAKFDLAVLDAAGFKTHRDFVIYGCVDATVSREAESTIIQWFAETRLRFFPLVRDEQWGARLHQADLAVNKVLAAAGRSKARDIADSSPSVVTIVHWDRLCLRRPASRLISRRAEPSTKSAAMHCRSRLRSLPPCEACLLNGRQPSFAMSCFARSKPQTAT